MCIFLALNRGHEGEARKNRITAKPLTKNIDPYSAMKKKLQRNPEYSV